MRLGTDQAVLWPRRLHRAQRAVRVPTRHHSARHRARAAGRREARRERRSQAADQVRQPEAGSRLRIPLRPAGRREARRARRGVQRADGTGRRPDPHPDCGRPARPLGRDRSRLGSWRGKLAGALDGVLRPDRHLGQERPGVGRTRPRAVRHLRARQGLPVAYLGGQHRHLGRPDQRCGVPLRANPPCSPGQQAAGDQG
ncbi:hypothetical protein D3C85_1303380 [compost metagenome]